MKSSDDQRMTKGAKDDASKPAETAMITGNLPGSQAILQIEDEEHDVFFLKVAMNRLGAKNPVVVARDGREAIAYLSGEGKFEDRQKYPLPGLVLLDIKLPQVPGLEVLKWIRAQPNLARLPVIIFSSSAQDSDVDMAYDTGANAFVVKPSSPTELLEVIRCIHKYWLESNGPPAGCKDWLSIVVPRPGPDLRV